MITSANCVFKHGIVLQWSCLSVDIAVVIDLLSDSVVGYDVEIITKLTVHDRHHP